MERISIMISIYVRRKIQDPGVFKMLFLSLGLFVSIFLIGTMIIALVGGLGIKELLTDVFNKDLLLSPILIRYTVIISLISLAFMINVASGFTNLGGEGQITLGMLGLLLASIYLPDLSIGLVISLLLIFIWQMIPYILKIYRDVSDVLTSFIMNFIALFMINHIVTYVFRGDIARPRSPPINEKLSLHYVSGDNFLSLLFSRVSIESIVTLLIFIILLYIVLLRHRIGYSIRMIGYSVKTASLSGVKIPIYMIISVMISSLLLSIASAEMLLGGERRIYYNDYAKIGMSSMSFGLGYTALGIALLSNGRSYLILIYSYLLSIGYMIVFTSYGYFRLILGTAVIGLSLLSALLTDLLLRYEVKISWSQRR
ncbi:MAG: hypothetical protein LM586_00625 [Desulfurococcales archaeon]|nr:hypothetical protein [Desulfurococcales archaeon]MCC6061450.1 hypothetical protein [Desulfurococcales archaeon]